MDSPLTGLLPADFPSFSRVWIYQADRSFSSTQSALMRSDLDKFISQWQSHSRDVKGFGSLVLNRFVILMADESQVPVGGCSTDSSIHFIKSLEVSHHLDFFNREMLAFLVNDQILTWPVSGLQEALEQQLITGDTLYFNNLAATKMDLETHWLIPVRQSWLYNRYFEPNPV
ncbi:MAG TPA: hypothetical protein VNE41_09005 [Chitinophagaceae bacterium]|nr:hypothetical protein [Chitinophagaceae bacterium]